MFSQIFYPVIFCVTEDHQSR